MNSNFSFFDEIFNQLDDDFVVSLIKKTLVKHDILKDFYLNSILNHNHFFNNKKSELLEHEHQKNEVTGKLIVTSDVIKNEIDNKMNEYTFNEASFDYKTIIDNTSFNQRIKKLDKAA